MLPEIFLIFSLIFVAAGMFFTFGAGQSLLAVGVYLGAIAFMMAKGRNG